MKKLAVLGLLIVLSSGCGRGWLPLSRGARCGDTCGANSLPAQPAAGCAGCGSGYGAGYSAYDGEVVDGSAYYGSSIVGDGYISPAPSGSTVPPMTMPAP
jgi:hypothetical protein